MDNLKQARAELPNLAALAGQGPAMGKEATMVERLNRSTIWLGRQARYTVADLTLAIRQQCVECNCVERWDESNDCVSPACALYPFRPGEQRPEVAGIRRATRSAAKGEAARSRLASRHSSLNKAARIGAQGGGR